MLFSQGLKPLHPISLSIYPELTRETTRKESGISPGKDWEIIQRKSGILPRKPLGNHPVFGPGNDPGKIGDRTQTKHGKSSGKDWRSHPKNWGDCMVCIGAIASEELRRSHPKNSDIPPKNRGIHPNRPGNLSGANPGTYPKKLGNLPGIGPGIHPERRGISSGRD